MTTQVEAERTGLLRSILERPDDDTPRLIFADWCEDNGEADRAEFIRAQMAAVGGKMPSRWPWSVWWVPGPFTTRVASRTTATDDSVILFYVPSDDWVLWHRGFVEAISLPLAAFMEHARDLFAAYPIISVTLTDREPIDVERAQGDDWQIVFGWYRWHEDQIGGPEYQRNDIPPELWDLMDEHLSLELPPPGTPAGTGLFKDYYSREEACTALFRAAVAYGRDLVGLPRLPGG
jgi:uncharacterized protein (TIGR02996 family)